MPWKNETFVLIFAIYFVQSKKDGIYHLGKKGVTGFYNTACVLLHPNKRFSYSIDNSDIFFLLKKRQMLFVILPSGR